jgi:hypothetical protein
MGRGTPKSSSRMERMVFSFVGEDSQFLRSVLTNVDGHGMCLYESGCGTLHGRDAVAAAAANRGREACRESA